MTIFRSELTSLAALLALAAPALAAQQPPAVQRPIQAAQGAANATNQNTAAQQAPGSESQGVPARRSVELGGAQQNTGINSQTPASHIVQQGETLWSLAQQYLGDPMLWPEIYRLNTTVVEDPHWIYPGEELRLSAVEPPPDTTVVVQGVAVVPEADSVARPQAGYASLTGPTIFSQPAAARIGTGGVEASANRSYRAVREGEYFSSGFLTEGDNLNAGRVISTSGELRDVSRTRTTAHMYETILIAPPSGGVQPGDLLLSFRRSDEVGEYGEIIVPTGLVRARRAIAQGDNLFSAEVVQLFGSLAADQELLKVQPFTNNSNQRAQPVSGGLEGRVLRMRDNRNIAQMMDVVFVDLGANVGVRLGDIMQIYVTRTDAERGGVVEQDQGRGIVVNTRARTATLVIVELYRGDVGSQSQVRQIRRMPS